MSQPGRLHLTLTDTAPQVADALEAAVEEAGLAEVEVACGSLFAVGADTVVSPATASGSWTAGSTSHACTGSAHRSKTASGRRSGTGSTASCSSVRR